MSDIDAAFDETGVVKHDLDTAIIVGKLLCKDGVCDAEQRGQIIAGVYKRLEELGQEEEEV